eukprot:Phypoly_transcript_18725.p1 GENE.Phypoly_transcript_18725~~Phypoly_transcript_18725.p1  ORF type:complete len:234 (+),score=45.90 Phypoly_transcript_18725:92-703(+)
MNCQPNKYKCVKETAARLLEQPSESNFRIYSPQHCEDPCDSKPIILPPETSFPSTLDPLNITSEIFGHSSIERENLGPTQFPAEKLGPIETQTKERHKSRRDRKKAETPEKAYSDSDFFELMFPSAHSSPASQNFSNQQQPAPKRANSRRKGECRVMHKERSRTPSPTNERPESHSSSFIEFSEEELAFGNLKTVKKWDKDNF